MVCCHIVAESHCIHTTCFLLYYFSLNSYIPTDDAIEVPRYDGFEGDDRTLTELANYFRSITHFPELEVKDGRVIYKFRNSQHCLQYTSTLSMLYPNAGKVLLLKCF